MEEQIKIIAAISLSITGAIIGWMTVLKPLLKRLSDRKEAKKGALALVVKNDKAYRETVLNKLEDIDKKQSFLQDNIAKIQRDSIERSYCMFVIEHGYCPSGMKMAIAELYDAYSKQGYNHVAKERIRELLQLPEFPDRIKEEKER